MGRGLPHQVIDALWQELFQYHRADADGSMALIGPLVGTKQLLLHGQHNAILSDYLKKWAIWIASIDNVQEFYSFIQIYFSTCRYDLLRVVQLKLLILNSMYVQVARVPLQIMGVVCVCMRLLSITSMGNLKSNDRKTRRLQPNTGRECLLTVYTKHIELSGFTI